MATAMLLSDKLNPGLQCSRGKSVYLMSGGLELSSFHPSSHYKQLLWVGSTIHDATGKQACATFIHIRYTCLNLHVMRSGVQHQPVVVQLVIGSFPRWVCAEGTLAETQAFNSMQLLHVHCYAELPLRLCHQRLSKLVAFMTSLSTICLIPAEALLLLQLKLMLHKCHMLPLTRRQMA